MVSMEKQTQSCFEDLVNFIGLPQITNSELYIGKLVRLKLTIAIFLFNSGGNQMKIEP